MENDNKKPSFSPRRLRLLKGALPDYERLKAIRQAATLDLRELFLSIEFHERGIAASTLDGDIKGTQFLSQGRSWHPSSDGHQYAAEWRGAFLETVAEWKNNIPDYAEGVKTYELFRKSIPENVRMNAAEILTRRQNPAVEPGVTLELLQGVGFDAPLLGQIEAHLQLRRICRLLFGRHSSGVTPQSSKRWPGHVNANNDPLGLYSGKEAGPNLAFFSRRDNLKTKLLAQLDDNAAHWEIDPDLPIALYLDRVCENLQSSDSWVKLARLYYGEPDPKKGLMLKGLAEVEGLIKRAKLTHGSPMDAIRHWEADLIQWQHDPQEAAILGRELQFLEWRYRPTLCAPNVGYDYRYVGVEGDLSPSLRAIAGWLISREPIEDIFTPGEIGADWKSTIDESENAKAHKKALKRLDAARVELEIIHGELAALDEPQERERTFIDPEKEKIFRLRREKKDRRKLDKREAREIARIEQQKANLLSLTPVSPIQAEDPKAARERAREEATKRRLFTQTETERKIQEQARVKKEKQERAREAAAAKRSAVKDTKPQAMDTPVEKKMRSPERQVPASKEEWAASRAARTRRRALRRRRGPSLKPE